MLPAAASLAALSVTYSFLAPPLPPRPSLQHRHVLVTGGSKGLGRALALHVASPAHGHKAWVTVVARTKKDVDEVVGEIRAAGGRAQGFSCDVTDEAQVKDMVAKAETSQEEFGPVDILVACAGMALTGKFLDRPLKDFEAQMRLNYLGAVAPTQVVVGNMVRRGQRGGKIVLVASQAALTGCVGYAAYCPSKFALRGLGEVLRNELLPHGIDVHVAFPGNMRTPGYEIEQLTKPAETKEIEAGEPIQEPEEVARAMIHSLRKGEYALYGGNYSGWAVGRASGGMMPRSSMLVDLFVAPLLIVILWAHRVLVLDRVVMKHHRGGSSSSSSTGSSSSSR